MKKVFPPFHISLPKRNLKVCPAVIPNKEKNAIVIFTSRKARKKGKQGKQGKKRKRNKLI